MVMEVGESSFTVLGWNFARSWDAISRARVFWVREGPVPPLRALLALLAEDLGRMPLVSFGLITEVLGVVERLAPVRFLALSCIALFGVARSFIVEAFFSLA